MVTLRHKFEIWWKLVYLCCCWNMCMEALLANFDKIPKTNTKIPLPITFETSTPFNKRKEKEMT